MQGTPEGTPEAPTTKCNTAVRVLGCEKRLLPDKLAAVANTLHAFGSNKPLLIEKLVEAMLKVPALLSMVRSFDPKQATTLPPLHSLHPIAVTAPLKGLTRVFLFGEATHSDWSGRNALWSFLTTDAGKNIKGFVLEIPMEHQATLTALKKLPLKKILALFSASKETAAIPGNEDATYIHGLRELRAYLAAQEEGHRLEGSHQQATEIHQSGWFAIIEKCLTMGIPVHCGDTLAGRHTEGSKNSHSRQILANATLANTLFQAHQVEQDQEGDWVLCCGAAHIPTFTKTPEDENNYIKGIASLLHELLPDAVISPHVLSCQGRELYSTLSGTVFATSGDVGMYAPSREAVFTANDTQPDPGLLEEITNQTTPPTSEPSSGPDIIPPPPPAAALPVGGAAALAPVATAAEGGAALALAPPGHASTITNRTQSNLFGGPPPLQRTSLKEEPPQNKKQKLFQ